MAILQTRAIHEIFAETSENDEIDLNVLKKELNNLHNSPARQYLTKDDSKGKWKLFY